MDFKSFLKNKEEMRRPLPIFILADVSGSMDGAKIKQLNLSLRKMLTQLNETKDIPGKFQLSVLTFNDQVNVVQPLADVDQITLQEFGAGGRTAMGAAFEKVSELIEDRNVVDSRAYRPMILLMSDGAPTDFNGKSVEELAAWKPLQKLKNGARSSKAQRLALAIGQDADEVLLQEFIGDPNVPLIRANNEQEIMRFFKWATMTVIARMKSVNPDDITLPGSPDIDEENI